MLLSENKFELMVNNNAIDKEIQVLDNSNIHRGMIYQVTVQNQFMGE